MDKHFDVTGLFEDFNFKLLVIDALLNLSPSFEKELEILKKKHVDTYERYTKTNPKPIAELMEYFCHLQLSQQDLDKVTALVFDGGNKVYALLIPDWDGEDSTFDIKSVKGFEHLTNLECVYYISMCDDKILSPMAEKGIIIK